MRQGSHAPCGFCDKQFIFLIKKEKREMVQKHYGFGFAPQDLESFCAIEQLSYLGQVLDLVFNFTLISKNWD